MFIGEFEIDRLLLKKLRVDYLKTTFYLVTTVIILVIIITVINRLPGPNMSLKKLYINHVELRLMY